MKGEKEMEQGDEKLVVNENDGQKQEQKGGEINGDRG